MSGVEALNHLRIFADELCGDSYYECKTIADAIECEISERYMLLPVDADGVPIRVGDAIAEKPFRPNTGEKPAEVVCMLLNSDGWAIGDCDPRGHWYGPLQLEHVKPDPLKELLEEFTDALNSQAEDDGRDLCAEYAERIRELMGDDAS